jgi:tetratricopeptide (TPR) repeat protein
LAEVSAALGRFAAAEDAYRLAVSEYGADALVGQARMLAALGRREEALAVFASAESSVAMRLEMAALLLDLKKSADVIRELEALENLEDGQAARRDYLLAHAYLLQDDPKTALNILQRKSRPDAALAANMVMLKASCLSALSQQEAAEALLEKFIESQPAHPDLAGLFAALDRLYQTQTSPSSSELRRWSEDSANSQRALTATYYLARNEARLKRLDRAEKAFQNFVEASPDHALAEDARIELANLFLASNKPAQALAALGDHPGAAMDFHRGLAHAAGGNYAEAARAFDQSLALTGWESARFNAALSRILAFRGEEETPTASASWNAELQLAFALEAARRRDPLAASLLEAATKNLQPPLSDSAILAIAEWKYLQLDLAGARSEIRRVSSSGDSAERAAALSVFLEDEGTADSEPKTMAAAEQFLAEHPNSSLLPEVLLKLGEIHFRRGDYLSAQSTLQKAAEARPASPIAEKALFLAAQAASRSMSVAGNEEALEIYESVAKAGGPLALRARLAQALLLNALGRPKEAIPVLDKILESSPDDELKFATLIEKGDTYFLLGEGDASVYPEAIAAWRLAAAPEVPARWRNQALVKIGAASERLGEIPAALSSYHDVLSHKSDSQPEYFWYYKAGFDAARILESQAQVDEAIVIYEKLAAKDGPRSEEARQRLNALRLENFLWEEGPPGSP